MKLILLTLSVLLVGAYGKARYDNFKVYRVTPSDNEQLEALRKLEMSNGVYSFWTDATIAGKPVDIMVPPQEQFDFELGMNENNFQHEVYIKNVQEEIDNQAPIGRSLKYGWTQYNTLDEINDWLASLEKEFPGVVKVVKGGTSYENRDILGVHVSFSPENENRAVFLEGGIHAREWIAPATVTYILDQILRSEDETIRKMATSHDWYIFPNFNPDGYVYTFEHNRLWRKTRTPHGICRGADPNRNWGYKWMQGGASSLPCTETYAGPEAFSEIETKSMSEYITSLGSKIQAYLAFHSYSQLLLIPYGHSAAHVENYDELEEVGLLAAKSLAQRYGTQYTVGNIVETIYIASGGSMDWVKGTHQTRVTYTYELRDTGRHGFLLPPAQIIPTAEETMDSFITIITEFDKRS